MATTITLGKAGRLVVPKSLRDRLHLHEGIKLRIEVVADRLEMTPEVEEAAIEKRGKRRVLIGPDGFNAVEAVRVMREEHVDRVASRGRA
jgi:AbrB family looped-hinge helix DNA binding protein